ncbi:hypothetical protein [Paenibacillus turpanensis]|uniref:hypothetical protein n=1 Tax=Paenibacillus turpanensis TaxID=2689078 RepID=UPI00140B12E0|nr:hypothetical protein [Paenibacillus turpanensis]
MRVPQLRRAAEWLQGFGLFLAGMVVGAAVFNAVLHHNFDLVVEMNSALESELRDLKDKLDKERKTNKQTAVSSVVIHIQSPDNHDPLVPSVESVLKERIRKDLKTAIGKPAVYPDLYEGLIQDIYYDVQDKDYAVKLRYIAVIYSELNVWVTADPFVRSSP